LYGVSVAEAIARQNELAAKYGVTLQGAVTWALEFEDQPFFAGFRELATGGKANGVSYLVDKPVLNVFRMMGMLGGDYVAVSSTGALPLEQVVDESVRGSDDVNAAATRNGRELDVLLWNYHDDDASAKAANVRLVVTGVPVGSQVKVREYLMDAEHSNAYAAWQKMGSPAAPSAKQFRELQRAAELEHVDVATAMKNGRIELPVTLERQGVMLIKASW
jgi:xylan 1,4-beta-xylosidase